MLGIGHRGLRQNREQEKYDEGGFECFGHGKSFTFRLDGLSALLLVGVFAIRNLMARENAATFVRLQPLAPAAEYVRVAHRTALRQHR